MNDPRVGGFEEMQIQHRPSASENEVSIVTLETVAEHALTDQQLVRLCTNLSGIAWNHTKQRYDLDGKSFGPELCNGKVRRSGDVVEVELKPIDRREVLHVQDL